MTQFDLTMRNRQGQTVASQPSIQFDPRRWKSGAVGGPIDAEVVVTGSRAGLKALLGWLRYEVQIVSDRGVRCWWGYVHEVELLMDGIAIVASLDNLRNRISVAYSSLEGATEQALVTAWAENTVSTGDYGIKEHQESLGQATTAMANALRDNMLAQYAYPRLTRSLADADGVQAVLRCRGWAATNGWRYVQRSDGRLEHMPSGADHKQPVGWGISASNQIGFGVYGVHDAATPGRLDALEEGMKFTVAGSVSNNKTFTAGESTSEETTQYANNSIYFEPSDDIKDANAGMTMVKSDHWLRVQGSAANSRWHWVGSAGADHVRTSASVSGTISAEGTGPSITLTQAQRLGVIDTATYEAPGAASSVSITLHGYHVAQRITLGTAMKIDRVMVEAAKVGSPSDDLGVRIYSDSAGSLNTGGQLTAGTLAAANLTDSLTAVWVPVTTITLAPGSYWIVVRRSGSNDGDNYYSVGMTETAYGVCQMWTGLAWVAHAPGWYLKFKLWSVEDTGTMAEAMLSSAMQFMTLSGGFTSGVNGYPTMDQRSILSDELDRLVGVGTATGARVLVDVSPDKVLRLKAQTSAVPGETLMLYTADGEKRLTDYAGSPWEPGLLPVGLWVKLADLDSDIAAVGGLSPAFVEEAEYDAESGKWALSFAGERNLADLLKVRQG